jgi:hypothetical protein
MHKELTNNPWWLFLRIQQPAMRMIHPQAIFRAQKLQLLLDCKQCKALWRSPTTFSRAQRQGRTHNSLT